MKKPLRVLFLDDSEADAEVITEELKRSAMQLMTGRADSVDSFIAGLHSFAPDIVISDYSLTQVDSLAAIEILRAVRPTTPFIIVTAAITGAETVAAIRAGAEDLIPKAFPGRLVESISTALAVRRPLRKLTARQIEVLGLLAEGNRTKDIANLLGLSGKTIESHRGEIMRRLDIHDVVGLVRYAIRVGLIPLTS